VRTQTRIQGVYPPVYCQLNLAPKFNEQRGLAQRNEARLHRVILSLRKVVEGSGGPSRQGHTPGSMRPRSGRKREMPGSKDLAFMIIAA
jgi:hypothetical protein